MLLIFLAFKCIYKIFGWFVLQPGLDVAHHLADKGQQLLQRNAGNFGPHVLILSDSDTNDNKVFAVIQGNLIYEAMSIVDALDICLKAAFVFGVSFPSPARSSWTFIQKVVYGISSEGDFTSVRLSEIMSAMKN
jgi:hypothetical protein